MLESIYKKNKLAFTLAEVLITLAVIGVVAALAIPALLTTINNAEYKTALKKQYAEATAVLKKIAYDRGGSLAGYSVYTTDNHNRTDVFKNIVLPYVNSTKSCGHNTDNGGMIDGCKLSSSEVYNYNGSAYTSPGWTWRHDTKSAIVLSNGAVWYFYNYKIEFETCSDPWIVSGIYANKACGVMAIDTNGFKKPNKTNSDIFEFIIAYDGTLIPFGSQFDAYKDTRGSALGYNPKLVDMLIE